MSKHVETLRSVMLFATVLLLIIVLYRRLLFVMGKRKSMTATSDVSVRLEGDSHQRYVAVDCKKNENIKITLHSPEQAEPVHVFDGQIEAGTHRTSLPQFANEKAYCKVKFSGEEFNLYL
jgi:hypothetical protein